MCTLRAEDEDDFVNDAPGDALDDDDVDDGGGGGSCGGLGVFVTLADSL